MKTVNIHGKEYVTVASRVDDFRKDFPDGIIDTSIVSFTETSVLVKAIVTTTNGGSACGLAYETKASSKINATSFVENAETSAVGRALAFLGYGTEVSIASADEVQLAISQQGVEGKSVDDSLKALPQDVKDFLKSRFSSKSDMLDYLTSMMWDVETIRKEFSL